jgi:hypothetical protein
LLIVVGLSGVLLAPTVAAQENPVTVPDVRGMRVPQAAALLNRNGLVLGAQTGMPWSEATGLPTNTVGAQSLAPGESVAWGSAVDVSVLQTPNVALIYDESMITLVNQSSSPLDLTTLVFNTVEGPGAASFPASNWQNSLGPGGRCAQLWAVSRSGSENLPECGGVDRWLSTRNTEVHFWTNGAVRFNVVQNGVERVVCQGAAPGGGRQRCDFYVADRAGGGDATPYVYLAYTTDRLIIWNQSVEDAARSDDRAQL